MPAASRESTRGLRRLLPARALSALPWSQVWVQVRSAPHGLLSEAGPPPPAPACCFSAPAGRPGDQGRQQPWVWAGEAWSQAGQEGLAAGEGLRGRTGVSRPPASRLCDLRQVAQPP